METVTLKIGGRDLELTKSDQLVGVKPRPSTGHSVPLGRPTAPDRAVGHPVRLGGFELLDVSQAPQDVEEALEILRSSPEITTGTHVFHTSDDKVPFVPTGQLFVAFADTTSPDDQQRLLRDTGLQIVQARGDGEFVCRVTEAAPNPVTAAKRLQESGLVEIAEPDLATPGAVHAFALPADPLLAEQWHLRNTGTLHGTTVGLRAGADARVLAAWERLGSLGSPEVVVAVIDDGFDLGHPDFDGESRVVAPWDFTRNGPDPSPDVGDWHGTACAGVAVGSANGTGIVGAAPGCRMLPVRWGTSLTGSSIAAWFDYVRDQGAWVVSCSWGAAARVFVLPTLASRAIRDCAQRGRGGRGAVVCFAAGNEDRDVGDLAGGSFDGFATHPDVLAVAASTSLDERSHYSNFGAEIGVCAPSSGRGGWGIVTADVRGQYVVNGQVLDRGYDAGDHTRDFGGTSSACPLVAGVAALVLSADPELTAAEVRALLERTARRIGRPEDYDETGHSALFGFGCVDAEAAVAAALELAAAAQPLGADTA